MSEYRAVAALCDATKTRVSIPDRSALLVRTASRRTLFARFLFTAPPTFFPARKATPGGPSPAR